MFNLNHQRFCISATVVFCPSELMTYLHCATKAKTKNCQRQRGITAGFPR